LIIYHRPHAHINSSLRVEPAASASRSVLLSVAINIDKMPSPAAIMLLNIEMNGDLFCQQITLLGAIEIYRSMKLVNKVNNGERWRA